MKTMYMMLFTLCFYANNLSCGFIIPAQEGGEKNSIIDTDNTFITISLGCNCHPATFTRVHGIRFFASPFDWVLAPYQTLYNCIKDDFKDFLKTENLMPSSRSYFPEHLQAFLGELEYNWSSEASSWILDKESGMISIHDYPDNSFASINQHHEFQNAKYERRIRRFYNEMNAGKHVYFIRYLNITKSEACELYELLKYKFPKTAFTLIVIGNKADLFEQDWGIPHIKNFFVYSEQVTYTDYEKNPFWRELCNNMRNGSLIQ